MEIFCLTETKNFLEEPFCVAENFWYRKMSRRRGRERGESRLSLEILLSHRTEQLRRGNLCFRKVLVSKNVKDKRERGHHDSPSKICCLNTEKHRRGNLCFRKLLVSQIFMDERGRKVVSRFYVGNFLSHSAETFCRGTLLCCRKFLVSKNVTEKREEGITTFHRKFVV